MDPIQTMPEIDALCKNNYDIQAWLKYYKNIWVRNLTARCIDMQTDVALKAKNPEEQVQADDRRPIPVKERLEERKALVQDALDLIAAIDVLLALSPEDFVKNSLSAEALAVAADMVKPTEATGPKKYKVLKEFTLEAGGQPSLVDTEIELTDEQAKSLVDSYTVTLVA